MKKFVVCFLIAAIGLSSLTAVLYAKGRTKQYRLAATSTSTVTVSFVTTYGFRPTSLIASSLDGEFSLRFHGVDGRAGTWQTVRAGGTPVVIPRYTDYPVDTLLIVPSQASGTLDIQLFGGE